MPGARKKAPTRQKTTAVAPNIEDAPSDTEGDCYELTHIRNPTVRPRNTSSALQTWEPTPQYEADVRLLSALTKLRTGYEAKPAQLRFLLALYYGKDVTCIAATRFGKSLAFHMVTFLLQKHKEKNHTDKRFGIVVTAIEALGENQVEEGGEGSEKAVAKDPDLLAHIVNGQYDLVYVSPENLMQRNLPFQKFLRAIKRKGVNVVDRIVFMVTDECH
ncbi:hypothetical protein EV426DRAFT_704489 [Tirmania nivea]|nr:hypothetical protein EV426DRAFT_704489 [Tirmania nivea]